MKLKDITLKILLRKLRWLLCLFTGHVWEYYDRGRDDDYVKLFCVKCLHVKEFKREDAHKLKWQPLNKWEEKNMK